MKIATLLLALSAYARAGGYSVVQESGAWWFKSPSGGKFLSMGVDCVGMGPETWPAENPHYSAHRQGYRAWEKNTVARFKDWGFNSIGGWSDARLPMHYFAVLHIQSRMNGIWWDLWDYDYEGQARKHVEESVKEFKSKPNLAGYFIDNELVWVDDYLLPIALSWDAKAPGKRHLVEVLKKTYGSFGSFKAEFDTTARNWDALAAATQTARKDGRGGRALDAWTYEVARRYYTVCSEAIRRADPGKLVVGDRFQQYYPQAVARAAKGVLDVISTNYEAQNADGWVSPAFFRTLHELSGLPILVGEFYSTARQNRSGNKNKGGHFTLSDTQETRAFAAKEQVRQFAAIPSVVGWHWFQFNDEPTHGRGDGEDFNMGLVDIHDKPYEEITSAFREIQGRAAALHAAGPAKESLEAPRRGGIKADGDLLDWEKSSPIPYDMIKAPEGLKPVGEFWLGWDEKALYIAARTHDFAGASKGMPSQTDEKTWGEACRFTVNVGGFEFYGAGGVAPDACKSDSLDGVAYTFMRPPRPGRSLPAASCKVKKWTAVWELAIPASEIKKGPLRAGLSLDVKLRLQNHADFEEMSFGPAGVVLR